MKKRKEQSIDPLLQKAAEDLDPVYAFLLGMHTIIQPPYSGRIDQFLVDAIKAVDSARSHLHTLAYKNEA